MRPGDLVWLRGWHGQSHPGAWRCHLLPSRSGYCCLPLVFITLRRYKKTSLTAESLHRSLQNFVFVKGFCLITVMVLHEVEDVDFWLASPRRKDVFCPLGIRHACFVDPLGSNLVGMIVEVPDMETLVANLNSPANVAAMNHDGVIRSSIKILLAQDNIQG